MWLRQTVSQNLVLCIWKWSGSQCTSTTTVTMLSSHFSHHRSHCTSKIVFVVYCDNMYCRYISFTTVMKNLRFLLKYNDCIWQYCFCCIVCSVIWGVAWCKACTFSSILIHISVYCFSVGKPSRPSRPYIVIDKPVCCQLQTPSKSHLTENHQHAGGTMWATAFPIQPEFILLSCFSFTFVFEWISCLLSSLFWTLKSICSLKRFKSVMLRPSELGRSRFPFSGAVGCHALPTSCYILFNYCYVFSSTGVSFGVLYSKLLFRWRGFRLPYSPPLHSSLLPLLQPGPQLTRGAGWVALETEQRDEQGW